MYGPRGNGKTVLLAELRGLAVKEGVRVLTLAPLEPEDRNPKNPWQIMELFAPPVETTTTFQSGVPGMASESESTKSVSMPPSIGNLLSLAKNGPVLLAVDEAHMLPVGFGRSVLHTAQTCISYGYPVMCVFAGTPGLRENFRAMHASFWERSKRIRIGRLDTDAAVCEALAVPATNSGLSFDDDALDLLMGEAQRYPFFIQMLGSASWATAYVRGGDRITVEDVRAGIDATHTERVDFYEDRRNELIQQGVIDDAEAVSEEMAELKDGEALPWQRMMKLLAGNETKPDFAIMRQQEVQGKLVNLGMIWSTPDADWEPGIPSFCSYLVKHRGRR